MYLSVAESHDKHYVFFFYCRARRTRSVTGSPVILSVGNYSAVYGLRGVDDSGMALNVAWLHLAST